MGASAARIKQWAKQRAEKVKAMRAILDLAASEDRELTEKEQGEYDGLNESQKALGAQIEREQELADVEADLGATATDTAAITDLTAPNAAGAAAGARATTQPVRGRAGADRAGERPFASLGEQLQAIIRAGRGDGIDPRLNRINAAVSGASEGTPSDGGFAVAPEFLPGIVNPIYETGEIASRVRRFPVGADKNGIRMQLIDETSRANGSRWGGIQFKMASEGDQGTPSKPKLRPYELSLKKAIGMYFMTDELMEDSIAMQGVLEQGFQTELEFFVEDKFFRGTGAGEPLGFLNAACTVSQAIEGGQNIANSPASIVLNATKMKSQMPPSLYRNAVWLANSELEPTLVAATLGGTAAAMPVFLQQGSLANSPYAQLLGKPLIYVEYCEAVGTPGDFVLAALGEYGCCDKNGATGASSIHLRFDYDETAFRVTYRFDGSPSWKQSVTKYKGAGKWAPFITLALRT